MRRSKMSPCACAPDVARAAGAEANSGGDDDELAEFNARRIVTSGARQRPSVASPL
jgi:hypothetical protein